MENSFPVEPSNPEQIKHRANGDPSAAADISSTIQETVPAASGQPSSPSAASAPTDSTASATSEAIQAGQAGEESTPEVTEDSEEPPSVSENSVVEDRSAEEDRHSSSLEALAERAGTGRLNPTEESTAAKLLTESLLGGRADVARAVALTPLLPWIVSVQAATQAWPEMKASFRAQFLAGLARTQGESAARIRLSLARGLYKVDQVAARKLILLTLKLLRNKQTGLLEGKGAAMFANVLIGRGKAWVLQIPLQEMKPVEADLLVFSALHGAFHAPQAPVAQLGILRWASASERLSRLPEALEQLILKNVARWSAKWQSTLRKEIVNLPESLTEQLKGHAKRDRNRPAEDASPANQEDTTESSANAETDEHGPALQDVQTEESHRNKHERDESANDGDDNGDDEQDEEDEDDSESDSTQRSARAKQRPVYVSKTVPNSHTPHAHVGQSHSGHLSRRGGTSANFNLQETLRQIDGYVAGLRNELLSAQKQLRQREDDPRRGRRSDRPAPGVAPGDLSVEELLRLNQQLEARNTELNARIEELTTDSEERAASSGLTADTATPDTGTQLRLLLGFKLKDDYEDFLALQQEARDLVVQQHYKTVLEHVFEVLETEGVPLPKTDNAGKS